MIPFLLSHLHQQGRQLSDINITSLLLRPCRACVFDWTRYPGRRASRLPWALPLRSFGAYTVEIDHVIFPQIRIIITIPRQKLHLDRMVICMIVTPYSR